MLHLNPLIRFKYLIFRIEFDEALIEKIMPGDLQSNWGEQPPPPSTQQIGDQWFKQSRSVVLELPSLIVPIEINYLLNPVHPDFKTITIAKPEPFSFDPRPLLP